MTFFEIIVLAGICFLGMLSPGPDFILVTRNAITQKRSAALATAAGVIAGCLVHATYCILGLAWLITQSILIYSTLKYLGAAYLVYIGVKGLCSKIKTQSGSLHRLPEISMHTAFMQGFLCNVLNPKLAIFLLSLFTQFISPDASLGQKCVVAGVFVLESALYWPLLVLAFQLPIIRSRLHSAQRHLDKICGAVLIALGIRVAFNHG